mgnify:CR=1 FL=1
MNKNLIASLLLLLFIKTVSAGEIYTSFPKQIHANETYVFYSHGFIVEGDNPTPVNPRWGMYDFPAVKQALADDDYNLIAYHRPKGTDPEDFARKLAADIDRLVNKGVSYDRIALVGFSRGGSITALTSNFVASDELKTIILAGCAGYVKKNKHLKVYGYVYSIYETSDAVGSCQFLIDRNPSVTNFEEIAISTGKEHGAFYTPIKEWVNPVKDWIKLPIEQ